MILLHQQRRGLSDDSAPRLLSTRNAGPTLVVAHAATPLAQSTRCRSQDTPSQSIQSKRKRSREPKPFAGLTPPPVPCVHNRPRNILQLLRYGPIPCRSPIAAPVLSIPPCSFVLITVVTRAGGWG